MGHCPEPCGQAMSRAWNRQGWGHALLHRCEAKVWKLHAMCCVLPSLPPGTCGVLGLELLRDEHAQLAQSPNSDVTQTGALT